MSLYKRYVELVKIEQFLAEEKKLLGDQILADLQANGMKTVKQDDATFSVVTRKKWAYTIAVLDIATNLEKAHAIYIEPKENEIKALRKIHIEPLEDQLGMTQQAEQESGLAVAEESYSLRTQLK